MNPLLEKKAIIAKEIGVPESELSDFSLEVVWEQIVEIIGYNPLLQERIEKYKGNGTDSLYLDCRPIKSITSLRVNDKLVENAQFSDEFIYIFTNKGYEKYELPVMYDKHVVTDEIEVIYMAGYETLPSIIVMAAILMLNNNNHMKSEQGNLTNYKIDTIAYGFKNNNELRQEVTDMLRGFMVP